MTTKISFLLAINNKSEVIGCIGVEQYLADGLLRSFAVDEKYRSRKVGINLFRRLISYSRQSGIEIMHLLTTTAEKYFTANGFVVAERSAAPATMKDTTEFSSLCPSSSTYMKKDITNDSVAYYSDIQKIKKDKETGADFWSINGKNLQFTWFEVPSQTKFAKHQHDSEQITYVLEGLLFFKIENNVYRLAVGDSIVIPSGKEHSVWTEDLPAKAVDAWSPVNEKYISV
ncbi:MAG: GNAT family N-acetyltransferase [Chitinophagaceae bacterium]|nr:GNAT family N-acetyltransferase [Chitinophagaceae bacterium]